MKLGVVGLQPAPSGKRRSGSREHTIGSAGAGLGRQGRQREGERAKMGGHGAWAETERPVNATPHF